MYVNIVDICRKVERHKGKINKTLNVSLTELEMTEKREFVFIKINNIKIKLQLINKTTTWYRVWYHHHQWKDKGKNG